MTDQLKSSRTDAIHEYHRFFASGILTDLSRARNPPRLSLVKFATDMVDLQATYRRMYVEV